MIQEYFASEDYKGVALSSTSANHFANKAKELFEAISSEIDGFKFINVQYDIAGKEPVIAEGGKTLDWLNKTVENAKLVGKLKSLISWLREAISEKEAEGKRIHQVSLQMWLRDNGIEPKEEPIQGTPYMFDMDKPKKVSPVLESITEEDVRAKWSIGQRQHYLELEAEVANLGKLIHLKGAFNLARKELHRKAGQVEVISEGTESLTVKKYLPSADITEVDKVFLSLQDTHRKLQSELNGMKHAVEEEVRKFNDEALVKFREEDAKATQEYKEANAKYEEEYQKRLAATNKVYYDAKATYDQWYNEVSSKHNQWLLNEAQKVANLKVIIPANLMDVYNLVKDS